MTRSPVSLMVGLVIAGLAVVGCGDDDEAGGGPDPTGRPTPETTATGLPEPTATATPDPTPTEEPPRPATDTPEPTATPPDLPGEPFDLFVPAEGELIGVIGVAHDDMLEMHELPGESSPLIGVLPNLADTVEGTGEGRRLPASIWWKVRYDGLEGWAGSGFLARIGDTFDITADVVAANGGSYLRAETMLDLGTMVADQRATEEPASRVVVSVAPSVSPDDLGEIVIDVVGLGDDAVRGERLHVFGDGTDMGGEGFMLSNVEMTLLCTRGVSDGLCV